MAASFPKLLLAAALTGLAALLPAADKPSCGKPIEFKSEGTSEFDFGATPSAKTVLPHVSICQCDICITADLAEATNVGAKNSRWVFTGNVHVTSEQRGEMRSDKADVELRNDRIFKATVTGKPAQFTQQRSPSGPPARGHANQIVYDVNEGMVRFADDAWLSYGGREVNAAVCIYNIRQENAHCEKVQGTIVSKAPDSADPGTDRK